MSRHRVSLLQPRRRRAFDGAARGVSASFRCVQSSRSVERPWNAAAATIDKPEELEPRESRATRD
jgi:hypothetical protein